MNIEENYEENPAPAVTYKTNMQTQNHKIATNSVQHLSGTSI